ncbi:MAG: hypothetical protein ACLPWD_06095 [Methanobacterium sp.]
MDKQDWFWLWVLGNRRNRRHRANIGKAIVILLFILSGIIFTLLGHQTIPPIYNHGIPPVYPHS